MGRPPLLLILLCGWFVCLVSAAVEGLLVKVNDSTAIPCPAWNKAKAVKSTWHRSKTDEVTPNSTIYELLQSGVSVNTRGRRDMSVDHDTFTLTIDRAQIEDDAYFLCKVIKTNRKVTTTTLKRNVYISPKITWTGLNNPTYTENTAVTFVCTIEQVYPALNDGDFQMQWGTHTVQPTITRTRNADKSYRYTAQHTRTVTQDDDGTVVNCTVRPTRGDPDSLVKTVDIQGHVEGPLPTIPSPALPTTAAVTSHDEASIKPIDVLVTTPSGRSLLAGADVLTTTVQLPQSTEQQPESVSRPSSSSNSDYNNNKKKRSNISTNNDNDGIDASSIESSSSYKIPGISLVSVSVISTLSVIIVLIVLIGTAVFIRKKKSKTEMPSVDGSLPTSPSLPTKSPPVLSTPALPTISSPALSASVPVTLNDGAPFGLANQAVVSPSGMPLVAVNSGPTTEPTASPSSEPAAEDGPFIKTNIERVRMEEAETILNDAERNYQMRSNPRGKAILLSIDNFANVCKDRIGSDKDFVNLDIMFTELGFQVETWSNLTAQGIRARIQKEQRLPAHHHYDAFVMCVFSHGNKGTIQDCLSQDMDIMEELLKPFNAVNAPGLAHKPKMFFIQACQAERRVAVESDSGDSGMDYDAGACSLEDNVQQGSDMSNTMALGPSSHEMADFLLVHSALEGYPSYRHTEMGSFFIRDLVSVVRERCHQDHMADMMVEVTNRLNTRVTSSFGQISSTRSTLTRRVYLLPGYSTR